MTKFWVIMQKRKDGKIYCDLHKTNGKMYLIEEDAHHARETMGDEAVHSTVVPILACLEMEQNLYCTEIWG